MHSHAVNVVKLVLVFFPLSVLWDEQYFFFLLSGLWVLSHRVNWSLPKKCIGETVPVWWATELACVVRQLGRWLQYRGGSLQGANSQASEATGATLQDQKRPIRVSYYLITDLMLKKLERGEGLPARAGSSLGILQNLDFSPMQAGYPL